MRAALLRTRLLGALGLPVMAAGCSSPSPGPAAPPPGPTPRDGQRPPGPGDPTALTRVRSGATDTQGTFAGITPPLRSAWYATYHPGKCEGGMVANEHTVACQEAAQVVPGDGECSDPGSCPTADAKALGCPLSVGKQNTHRFLEPISTRLERTSRPTACCYGDAPVCQLLIVPGRPLVVGRARVAARRAAREWG